MIDLGFEKEPLMKHILIAVMFFATQLTYAGELDDEQAIIERSALAKTLPGSVVIRTALKDGKVEVLPVNQRLPADKSAAKVLAKAPFKPVSIDTQLAGTAADTDSISSTPSWFFGLGLAALGIGLGAYALGRSSAYASAPAYYGGVYAPAYEPFYGRPSYAPYYGHGGYTYDYRPYYAYDYGGYRYGYYSNPYVQTGFSARGYFDYLSLNGS